ncbi:MAG: SDR family NAD(P)-dependent oxidoreductase, partial [Deltaproteobacteria bacterium]
MARRGAASPPGAELASPDRVRVIVITGGTAGVGRATARRFARAGDAVAVLARGRDRLTATVAEIDRLAGRLGGRGLGIAADVSDPAQVE